MIRFSGIAICILVLTYIMYALNIQVLGTASLSERYDLLGIYVFLYLFYLLTTATLEIVYRRGPAQVGFGFLVTFFIKLAAFAILFYPLLFSKGKLSFSGKISILLPLLLFILLEAVYCAYLLRRIDR